MIRKDFENGGFPISRTRPVLCYTDEDKLVVAGDSHTLKTALAKRKIVKMAGVWPGRHDTDIFILDVDNYRDIPAPPARFRDIDQATEVIIHVSKSGKFLQVEWKTGEGEISTDDPALHEYVIKAGKKHKVLTNNDIL